MKKFVTGIGGVFFRAKDTKLLTQWYEKYFGINPVGAKDVWQQQEGPTVFAPFKNDTGYFPATQQFMINFRVKDLEGFLDQLRADGVKMDEKQMDESYGKFAWVYDPEGNKIELWEPSDS
jgi:predicted enzyme related to lactoylglutathione lyase